MAGDSSVDSRGGPASGPGLPAVRLKRVRHRCLETGHPWVYGSEIDLVEGMPATGAAVEVADANGRFVGRGFYNPQSVIAVRLVTRVRERAVDRALLAERIEAALSSRCRQVRPDGMVRLVFGESDGLPGLVVDRYRDVLVVQTLCAGMDQRKGEVVELLVERLRPAGVWERNDPAVRQLEGLTAATGLLYGCVPDELEVTTGDLTWLVDVKRGQKTGFYLDQQESHLALRRFAAGARVLDACCHTGAFGLHAAKAGAAEVLAIDQSEDALALGRRVAERNGLGQVEWRCGNVFDELRSQAGMFDLVFLDPPAFAKSKAQVDGAIRGYKELNLRALKLMRPGGILATFSCSYNMTRELFLAVVFDASRDARREVRLVEERSQSPDHPRLLSHDESWYLKGFVLEVV